MNLSSVFIITTLITGFGEISKNEKGFDEMSLKFADIQLETQVSKEKVLSLEQCEDIIFGREEVTTGAGGDVQQVASMARQMVTRFGMSSLGPVSLEGDSQEVFVGRSLMNTSDISDEISKQIDEQVRKIVKKLV